MVPHYHEARALSLEYEKKICELDVGIIALNHFISQTPNKGRDIECHHTNIAFIFYWYKPQKGIGFFRSNSKKTKLFLVFFIDIFTYLTENVC